MNISTPVTIDENDPQLVRDAGGFIVGLASCPDDARDIALAVNAYGDLRAALVVTLEHCEGKGWRSDDIAALLRGALAKTGGVQ